jgi:hypothetical protein
MDLGKAYDTRGKMVISYQALLLPVGDTRSIQLVTRDRLFRCHLAEIAR